VKKNPIIQQDLEKILSAPLSWGTFSDKTVLITGANGFLPAYLVEALLYLNEISGKNPTQILAIVRNQDRARARFAHCLDRKDLKFIVQDASLEYSIDGPVDFIVHAASQASPKYYGTDPVGTIAPNVFGTQNLLKLAYQKKTQSFLYFSSGEIYGQVDPSKIPMTEKDYGYIDLSQVRTCYGESKRMGETLCVSWFKQFGVPAKIVRPFHTYGPGMQLDDGRVFSDFVADVVHNRNIVMKSDGSAIRPYCYLSDAAVAFFTLLLKGENGEAYNMGNDRAEISVLELAETLVRLFPEKNLKVIHQMKDRGSSYLQSPIARNCPNISKIRTLGWKPEVSIPEGFKRTIESFL
jgi:nucleoside-diphosphate-sugar epimerase